MTRLIRYFATILFVAVCCGRKSMGPEKVPFPWKSSFSGRKSAFLVIWIPFQRPYFLLKFGPCTERKQLASFIYRMCILCTLHVYLMHVTSLILMRAKLIWGLLALPSLVSISGPKKVSIFRAHPFQWPSKWICSHQTNAPALRCSLTLKILFILQKDAAQKCSSQTSF